MGKKKNKGKNLGEFEILVLTALMRLKDKAYGIAIKTEIEKTTGRETTIGAIYATLERLENKGLISARMGEATAARGGRAKKFFSIESEGEMRLRESYRVLNAISKGIITWSRIGLS